MKLIPKHQNGNELIKRKQAFLKANGVNAKVDGRWGKWQQEQYDKLLSMSNKKLVSKTPYTLNQIPTKNKIIIIDNYSPNYNYIVEDDKIYYAKKRKRLLGRYFR